MDTKQARETAEHQAELLDELEHEVEEAWSDVLSAAGRTRNPMLALWLKQAASSLDSARGHLKSAKGVVEERLANLPAAAPESVPLSRLLLGVNQFGR